jgi:hypothetical protein
MDIYTSLGLKVADNKREPSLWVSRLVIYEQIDPDVKIIRDIPLSRGLNIIWAEEKEEDNSAFEITGHSAGKTTFCRLVRYILGESDFGRKITVKQIQESIKNGYVGAELHIKSRQWAVLRPIGKGVLSYIGSDTTLEELIVNRKKRVSREMYPEELGLKEFMKSLKTQNIARTQERIQWGHLLAWCTRDQEARFQNIYDWRSPRSESTAPGFQFPREGPLFVMRTALGLFLDQELSGEERLAQLYRDQDALKKKLERQKQEPDFRVNLYEIQLRKYLALVLPGDADIINKAKAFRNNGELLAESLEAFKDMAIAKLETSILEAQQHCNELQDKINALGADILEQERVLEENQDIYDMDSQKKYEIIDAAKRQAVRDKLTEKQNKMCMLGKVLYKDCIHIQRRQKNLQFNVKLDAAAVEHEKARVAEERKKFEQDNFDTCNKINQLREKLVCLKREFNAKILIIREDQFQLASLKKYWEEYYIWYQKREQPGGYKECDDTQKAIGDVEKELKKCEIELAELLHEHDNRRRQLQNIFSASVRTVLGSDAYDGKVGLDNRELNFQISRGPIMSSEAIDTLSILLADICCQIYNSVSENACLPGFLMHDSPREADLGLHIYGSFIQFVASISKHFNNIDCPFQYILTTTTPPPKELQGNDMVKLNLNAAITNDLLLRRNIVQHIEESEDQLV